MDLLQSQIKESCSLALPEGLKDLMSDISREVLRAKPNNIPQFIADYLEVMLEVREKLYIACTVCNDACNIISEPALYNELKAIGLSEENIDIAIKIVEEYWNKKNVKEQSLLIKLAKKISIEEMQLPLIRDGIQKAIKLRHIKDGVLSGSEDKDNEVTSSLYHTLEWHRQNKTTTEEVFMAPNFDPCGSMVSSTDPVSELPEYKVSVQDTSENDKEYISFDYTLNSTVGKVQFVEEKIISRTNNSDKEETRTSDGTNENGDDDNIDHEDYNDDYIANDINVMNDEADLSDNDIEEIIKSDFHDDMSALSVDEDFEDSEYGINGTP